MLAVHIDNLLFLLLVGAAGLMRLLAKRGASPPGEDDTSPPPSQNPPPLPRQEFQTDEERIRKFLEALGQPASSQPPAPIKPRTVPPAVTEIQRRNLAETSRAPRRRNVLNPLPPLTTVPTAEVPRRVTLPRQMTMPANKSATFDSPPPVPSVYEVQGFAPPLPAAAPRPAVINPVEAYAIANPSLPLAGSNAELIAFLKTSAALRQAIVLREIFGPPRSLQPFDQAGNL
jgi:hypothetical protein